jgi:SAM-dependent methyltransferase
MKVYKSKSKNIAYFGYRMVNQVFDPIIFLKGLWGYVWYFRDLIKFRILSPGTKVKLLDLYPQLHDKTSMTGFDAHYFYQQLWLFENVLKNKPKEHVDVGSTYQMSGYLSKIVPTTFIDIRPINAKLENLKVLDASILDLPYKDNSLESVSCLHVIEHIGLGRYGDKIDPNGWEKACKELQRVLAEGGRLYVSVPIGKSKVCFNAHRVFDVEDVLKAFNELKLLEFSAVDDNGSFMQSSDPQVFRKANYGLGMFVFKKP